MACRRESKKAQVQKGWVQKVRVQKAPGGGAAFSGLCPPCMVLCMVLCAALCGLMAWVLRQTHGLCQNGLCQTYRHGFGHHDKCVMFWPCGSCSGPCPGPVGVTGPPCGLVFCAFWGMGMRFLLWSPVCGPCPRPGECGRWWGGIYIWRIQPVWTVGGPFDTVSGIFTPLFTPRLNRHPR